MSHFSCLVITAPGEDPEAALAPYHEFECTGLADEHVKKIDKTEEIREEYDKKTTRRLRSPTGQLHEPWADRFYRDPTPEEAKKTGLGSGCNSDLVWDSRDWKDGRGYRAKIQFIPDGWEEVTIPVKEVETFVEWIEGWHGHKTVPHGQEPDLEGEHKYGYVLVDAKGRVTKVVDRTNPEAHWDWHELGGRWAGHWKLKEGVWADKPHFSYGWADEWSPKEDPDANRRAREAKNGHTDSCRKGDIDFEHPRRTAAEKAAKDYDYAMSFLGRLPVNQTWEEMLAEYPEQYDKVRKLFWEQPRCLAWKAEEKRVGYSKWRFGFDESPDDFLVSRDDYIRAAREAAGVTFAIVYRGKWFERGSMGFWGMVSDEKDQETWNSMFWQLVDSLPPTTLLSIYDCHV